MRRLFCGALCAVFFSLTGLFGLDSYRTVLPRLDASQYERLQAGDTLEGDTFGGLNITAIAPQGGVIATRAEEAQAASGPKNFAVASLAFFPYPEVWKNIPEAELQLGIFNLMRTISTQEGILYISHRRGNKPYPLFKETYYLSDPKDATSKVPDPKLDALPASLVAYAYQVDTSFDGNIYRHTFTTSDQEIFLDVTNLTAMKYRGITCLKPETLSLCMSTYLTKEGILFYSLATVDRAPKVQILFWSVDLPSSFQKRMTALKNWFVDRLATVQ